MLVKMDLIKSLKFQDSIIEKPVSVHAPFKFFLRKREYTNLFIT